MSEIHEERLETVQVRQNALAVKLGRDDVRVCLRGFNSGAVSSGGDVCVSKTRLIRAVSKRRVAVTVRRRRASRRRRDAPRRCARGNRGNRGMRQMLVRDARSGGDVFIFRLDARGRFHPEIRRERLADALDAHELVEFLLEQRRALLDALPPRGHGDVVLPQKARGVQLAERGGGVRRRVLDEPEEHAPVGEVARLDILERPAAHRERVEHAPRSLRHLGVHDDTRGAPAVPSARRKCPRARCVQGVDRSGNRRPGKTATAPRLPDLGKRNAFSRRKRSRAGRARVARITAYGARKLRFDSKHASSSSLTRTACPRNDPRPATSAWTPVAPETRDPRDRSRSRHRAS